MSAEVLPRRPQSAPELNMAEEAEDTLPELKMHQGVRTKTPGVSYVKKKRVRGGPRRKSHALNDGRPARMRDSSKKKQERSTAGSTVLSKSLQFIHKSLSNTRIQDYQVMEEIGKGGFGLVYRGMNVQTGATVAVKTVGLQGVPADEIENIQQEIMLMKNLDHLNIVQYMDAMNAEGYLCIILEYMEGGAISGLLSKFSNHLPEQLCKVYILQTLRGLEYLHSQGVIHRDIKGANILTTKEGIVKLADFGVAAKLGGKDTSADSVVGTPYWMAPEIIEMKSQHSHACDIWSVGCTVLELLTGKPPYFDLQQMPAMFRIVQDDHPPFPDNISPALEDFLLQCFQKDPSMRIDANGLLRHPWLKDVSAKVKDHESSSSSSSLPSHSVTSVSEVKSKHHRNNMSSSQLTTASISSPSSSKAPDDADLSEDWDAEIEEEERLVVDVPTKSGILSSRRGSLNGFELFTGEVDDDEDPFADMSDSDGDGNNDKGSRVSPRNNHNNGSNGSKGAFGRPTRSSSTRKQFADADEDDDFGELSGGLDDVFGAGVGAGGSSKYKLSAFTTLGAPDNAFEEEDDPFEDLEFDGAANNVPKSTEDMVLKNALKKIVNVFTQDEEDLVILEACKNLSELLETESDSKVQRLFADNRDTIIPIMDMLEGDNDTTLLLHILKLVNQIIGKVGKAFQQSMSVVGLTPVIIKFADPNQPSDIRLEAANFVSLFCSVSDFSRKMFVACGGLPVLVGFMDVDYNAEGGKKLVHIGVDCILKVFQITTNPKNDFCRLFCKFGLLAPLAEQLVDMCSVEDGKEQDPFAADYSARIGELVYLFSHQGDVVVKRNLAKPIVMEAVLKVLPQAGEALKLLLVKSIRNVAMESRTRDLLQLSGVLPCLIPFLDNEQTATMCLSQVLATMYDMCRLSTSRQDESAKYGIIPHLKRIIRSDLPIKQFAYSTILLLSMTKHCRTEMIKHGGLGFFMELLSDRNWNIAALKAVSDWVVDDPVRVGFLLSSNTNINKLITIFRDTRKPIQFTELLGSFHRMLSTSPRLMQSLCHNVYFMQEILSRFALHKTNSKLKIDLLRLLSVVIPYHRDVAALSKRFNLIELLSGLANDSSVRMAVPLAKKLLTICG